MPVVKCSSLLSEILPIIYKSEKKLNSISEVIEIFYSFLWMMYNKKMNISIWDVITKVILEYKTL